MASSTTRSLLRQRRAVLQAAVSVAALAPLRGLLAQTPPSVQGEGGMAAAVLKPSSVGGTRLVMLGTHGGPGVEPGHSQTACAVVVDETAYLIDCGYGTVRQLVAANVAYLKINQVFFTHLHDDHTADLEPLLSFQWTNGKTTPTDAYGPYGTARLVDATLGFIAANVEIRSVDEGRTLKAEQQFHGHDVAASSAVVPVFRDERVTVTAIQNTHYPERSLARMPHRAIALRFDSRDRSIVFSGDTAFSANIVKLARNADTFVCEVMDEEVHAQMLERARAAEAAGNAESVFRHVAETHSTPADVARMASEAGVRSVVLYHQVAGPTAPGGIGYPISRLIDGVRKAGYSGEVIVGQDLMVL